MLNGSNFYEAGRADVAYGLSRNQNARGLVMDEAVVDSPTSALPALLDVEGLTKSYGDVTALGPLSLRVEGGCVALLGPNGAGKSTLLRLMLGLAVPQAGTIKVLGEKPGPDVRRRIGYTPEGDAQFPGLTGVESVAYAGQLCGMPRNDAIQRSHQVLDYVGLADERYRSSSTYSSGMRQRLKLAQAIVHDPDALVLDEPTEGVDPEARRDLLALIKDLSTNHGVHVLMSTHLLPDVEAVATQAVVMDRGQIVIQGPLAQLKAQGKQGYVVRVDRESELFANRLTAGGLAVESVRGQLRIEGADAARILQEAQAAGVVVRHMAPLEMTMHEAFQQAIAGGRR